VALLIVVLVRWKDGSSCRTKAAVTVVILGESESRDSIINIIDIMVDQSDNM